MFLIHMLHVKLKLFGTEFLFCCQLLLQAGELLFTYSNSLVSLSKFSPVLAQQDRWTSLYLVYCDCSDIIKAQRSGVWDDHETESLARQNFFYIVRPVCDSEHHAQCLCSHDRHHDNARWLVRVLVGVKFVVFLWMVQKKVVVSPCHNRVVCADVCEPVEQKRDQSAEKTPVCAALTSVI